MDHQYYLLEALALAQQRRGFCAPNPSVGAIVVQDGQIIGQGYHQGPGHAHAEVIACQDLPDDLSQATLYITLEPCCHWGRTPPCTDLILKRQIKQVIYGYVDPNAIVGGKGAELLQTQGVDCQHVPLPDIDKFYQSYQHWTLTGQPWVTAKLAMSLDAKVAGKNREPVRITGMAAQRYTHEQRARTDAILTTAKTIIQDDPALNVRLQSTTLAKRIFIVDSQLTLPLTAQVLNTALDIWVFHSSEEQHKIQSFEQQGLHCQFIPRHKGQMDLMRVIQGIGALGHHDLWVEAGSRLFGALLGQSLIHKSLLYVAPLVLGPDAYAAFFDSHDFAAAKKMSWLLLDQDAVCDIDWQYSHYDTVK